MLLRKMFNIGFLEILVIAIVSVIALDEDKVPNFIEFIKDFYRCFSIVKSRAENLLRDTGIEDFYKECDHEKVDYIIGKDGKFYPSYNLDRISENNKDKDSSTR